MRVIADLHLHSKYSRACSKDLDLEHNEKWAKMKGINILGTADFTHPKWLQELKEKLTEEKPGLFKLNNSDGKILFMLTTEISCIYSQGGRGRRIHLCIFVPDFATIDRINKSLLTRFINLSSDGRPIAGLSAIELTKIVLDANPESLVIPAHAWTPWFSVFGSNSGFNSIEECFGEMAQYIYSIETGLSSDPAMNWRLSMLDKITLISNSDAHSPANLGREANVFDIQPADLGYPEIRRIIKEKDKQKFLYTIEFFPEEGKYHWDGHQKCNVKLAPAETKIHKNICPQCGRNLTIGVLNRVEELTDRPEGFKPDTIPYKSLVPLREIIAEALGISKISKKVDEAYQRLVAKAGSEFEILIDAPIEEIIRIGSPEIAQAVKNVREGKVEAIPGYDGVYGVIKALAKGSQGLNPQKSLF